MKGYRKRKLDANHATIVKALRAAGREVYEMDGAKDDDPGRPDVLAIWAGGFCWLEFKTKGQGLSPAQERWHAAYRGPKGTLATVWTAEEALTATGCAVARLRPHAT